MIEQPDTTGAPAYWVDTCPVCGQKATTGCRCLVNERTCPNGHEWYWDKGQKVIGSWHKKLRQAKTRPADPSYIHRAQLADMPLATIVAWLREQNYAVVLPEHEAIINAVVRGRQSTDTIRKRAAGFEAGLALRDRLPPGYPPRAEDDAPLPFEVGG